MKKISVILLLSFFLGSCWWSEVIINNFKKKNNIENQIISINNNQDLNISMIRLYNLIIEWGKIDKKLMDASIKKNIVFFQYFNESDLLWTKVLEEAINIESFLNKNWDNNQVSFIFTNAYAKKQWSIFYYVPILGSLLKAKHKTIETARAGVYYYLKDSLDDVDRSEKLSEYWIKDIEDIRMLENSKIEKLAQDPELRYWIDWTKITKELWETTVKTVVDASKTVVWWSFNPISDTIDNVKDDLKDWKIDTISGELKEKKWKLLVNIKTKKIEKVTFWIKKDIKEKINSLCWNKLWNNIEEKQKSKISKEILTISKEKPIVLINKTEIWNIDIDMGEWEWDFMISDENIWVYNFKWIDIEKNKETNISLQNNNLKVNSPREININQDKEEIKITTNLDIENKNNNKKNKISRDWKKLEIEIERLKKITNSEEYSKNEKELEKNFDWYLYNLIKEHNINDCVLEDNDLNIELKMKRDFAILQTNWYRKMRNVNISSDEYYSRFKIKRKEWCKKVKNNNLNIVLVDNNSDIINEKESKYNGLWLWNASYDRNLDFCWDSTIRLEIKDNKLSWVAHWWWDDLKITWLLQENWDIEWWFAKAKENIAKFKWSIVWTKFKWTWSDSFWCYWTFELEKDM